MSDRELLELAAKAAGHEIRESSFTKGRMVIRAHEHEWKPWDPLDHDGDALRLATILCMTVRTGPCEAAATTIAGVLRGSFPVEETINQPQDVAVRRVIVRAAAEFGENM